MKIRNILLLAILIGIPVLLVAQQRESEEMNMLIKTRMIGGKPVMKIIPANPAVWYLGMKNGYEISISEPDGKEFAPYRVLNKNLKPAAELDFNAGHLPKDYANGLRYLIYEDDFTAAGSSIKDISAASEAMSRKYYFFILMSSYHPELSKMSGLQYELPANLPDIFKIKVKINNENIEHEETLLNKSFYTRTSPPELQVQPGDHVVKLFWNHSNYDRQFVAYLPERSTDGKNFEKISAPIIFDGHSPEGKKGNILAEDSIPKNYTHLWYRIAGYDAFGILSEYTEPVKVMGRDMTPPSEPIKVSVKETKNPGEVELTWEMEPTSDLSGFQVIASREELGEYQILHANLLPPKSRSYKHSFIAEPAIYYRVLAVDTASNASASNLAYLVRYDTIPPAIPEVIRAEVDSNYIATINWSKSKSDDAMGYRLYKTYNPKTGYVPATAKIISDTVYYDTLRGDRLDKKIYYQLVALDAHYNHSKHSKAVAAAIPDTIVPTPPLLLSADLSSKDRAVLKWKKSSSTDVKSQIILARFPNDSLPAKIAEVSHNDTVYTTKNDNIQFTEYIEYYVMAIDSAKNKSPLSNGKRILFSQGREVVKATIQKIENVDNNVRIEWKYNGNDLYDALIYRSLNDEGFKLIGRVNKHTDYTDTTVSNSNTYRYKVGVISENGRRGPLSDVIEIKLD